MTTKKLIEHNAIVFADNGGGYALFVFADNEQIYAHNYIGMDISHRDPEQAIGEDLRGLIAAINRGDQDPMKYWGGDESDEMDINVYWDFESENLGKVKLVYTTQDGWEDPGSEPRVYAYATADMWIRVNQTATKIEDYAIIPNFDKNHLPRFQDADYHDMIEDWLCSEDEDPDQNGCWDSETDSYNYYRGDEFIFVERANGSSYVHEYGGDKFILPEKYPWSNIVEACYDPMDTLQMYPRYCVKAAAIRISDGAEGILFCEQFDPEEEGDDPDYADDEDVFFEESV